MNILQVITPSKVSGAERSTVSLCEHLQGAGHKVVIACKSRSPLIAVMESVGLDVHDVRMSGKLNAAAPFRLARMARDMDAKVINTQLSSAAWHGMLAGRLTKLPVVAHVRAMNSAFWYRPATRVIAVSQEIKRHLVAQGMPPDKIDVVYNGVDPARYYLPCTREEARRKLALPEDALIAGIVAHLTEKKGHAVFLDAFAHVARKHKNAFALFLGEGEERKALEAKVKALGLWERVLMPGFQPDVLPWYAAMDVVVLPSLEKEGLARAMLEGGMLSRACLGTRLGGVPEIVLDEKTGFVVPVGDVIALSGRLDELFSDESLRERFGKAAHEYVGATFTVQGMVEGVLASYRRAGAAD
jgi:glycosyltransferase involved in cell wall biosynthesis